MKNPVPPARDNAGVSSLPTVCTPPTQGRDHYARAWVGTRSCIYRQLRARVGTRSCIYRQFQRFYPVGYHQRRTVKRHPAAGSLHPPQKPVRHSSIKSSHSLYGRQFWPSSDSTHALLQLFRKQTLREPRQTRLVLIYQPVADFPNTAHRPPTELVQTLPASAFRAIVPPGSVS